MQQYTIDTSKPLDTTLISSFSSDTYAISSSDVRHEELDRLYLIDSALLAKGTIYMGNRSRKMYKPESEIDKTGELLSQISDEDTAMTALIISKIDELKSDLKNELHAVEGRLNTAIHTLKIDLNKSIDDCKTEIGKSEGRLEGNLKNTKDDLQRFIGILVVIAIAAFGGLAVWTKDSNGSSVESVEASNANLETIAKSLVDIKRSVDK
ncbi:MAG: hypothetical protein V4629_03270 [Pseudomonadota bacterium]